MWYRKRDDVPIPTSRFQERGEKMIRYELAEDIGARISDILGTLEMAHVDEARVACVRSIGSKSKRAIARCHGLSRIMQLALNQKPHYVIEVVSERFDKLSKGEQTKVLIHELMHIPHSFGGGFRTHKPYVTQKMVERMYSKFIRAR
jgi:predicted metallopeptidase